MNSKSGDVIQYDSFPVIGHDGQLVWRDPSEFLGGILYKSTTVLELLEAVQPGLSTLSTNFTEVRDFMLKSTVAGLGKLYISTFGLIQKVTELSVEHGYISTTSIYTCLGSLSKLDDITESVGPMVMFLSAIDSNFAPSGYISTVNPGKYHNYYSTLGFTGGLTNANNANINTGIQSLSFDLGGFEILSKSKMRIDINANVSVSYTNPPLPQSIVTSFSTFLYNGTRPIGIPVVVNYSNLNFSMSKFTYFLTANDLSSGSLELWHRAINFDNTNVQISVIPTSISATLINMD
jgi:hypothetical protein